MVKLKPHHPKQLYAPPYLIFAHYALLFHQVAVIDLYIILCFTFFISCFH